MANAMRRIGDILRFPLGPTGSHHLAVQEISDSGTGKLREELENFTEGGS